MDPFLLELLGRVGVELLVLVLGDGLGARLPHCSALGFGLGFGLGLAAIAPRLGGDVASCEPGALAPAHEPRLLRIGYYIVGSSDLYLNRCFLNFRNFWKTLKQP